VGAGASLAGGIDRNNSTQWNTGADQANGQWYQVDMGPNRTVAMVTVQTPNGQRDDYPRAYVLQLSTNGTTWTTVGTGIGFGWKRPISVTPQTARYIRITQTGTATNWWSVDEVTVYSSYCHRMRVVPLFSGTTHLLIKAVSGTKSQLRRALATSIRLRDRHPCEQQLCCHRRVHRRRHVLCVFACVHEAVPLTGEDLGLPEQFRVISPERRTREVSPNRVDQVGDIGSAPKNGVQLVTILL